MSEIPVLRAYVGFGCKALVPYIECRWCAVLFTFLRHQWGWMCDLGAVVGQNSVMRRNVIAQPGIEVLSVRPYPA